MSDFDHPVFGRMPERIFADRDVETNEKRWYSTPGMGEPYVRVDTNYRKLAEVEALRAEITKLKSQLEEARAEIERLKGDLSVSDLQLRAKRTTYIDDKVEEARAMAIEDCIAAARDAIERWSQTEGWLDAKVEDALRALLNGSANKEGGKS